jgi:hypothetical protein
MSEFGTEIAARVGRTTASLQAAQAADDDYLTAVLLGELESLARLAAEHDVHVPGLHEALERHAHPTDVQLPDERPTVLDLATSDLATSDLATSDQAAGEPVRRIA